MVLGPPRNAIAKKYLGLPKSKLKDFQAMLAATPTLTTVSRHVVQRPADWGELYQVTGYLFGDDPDWTPPQDLTDFLAAGAPPVVRRSTARTRAVSSRGLNGFAM